MSLNMNLRSIMNNNKLIGSNFLDWFKNLKTVLRAKKITYVLNRPLPQSPPIDTSNSVQSAYHKHVVDHELHYARIYDH